MVKFALIAAVGAFATAKISPSIHRHLEANDDVDVVIEFRDGNQAALRAANLETATIQTRGARIAHVRSLLESNMETSQRAAVELLSSQPEAFTTRVESFYINGNMHVYGANRIVLDELAKLDNVAHIRLPVVVDLPVINDDDDNVVGLPVLDLLSNSTSVQAANEWGLDLIRAPTVWATGNRGEGVVVGILDSGAIHTHDDLKTNWRSNYGWYDPSSKSPTPIDSSGHGSHVTGTAVGQNGIGVAPGATWIACRGCTTSGCPEAALTGCAQWMLCPTDVTGKNPKCELAPDVINNSWGGGSGSTWFQANVNAWRTAGIIPVFANGNAGPKCGTANSPGDYKNVIGVGAVGFDDTLASFSSRGPTKDGRIKPDVSAPGSKVRSAWNTGNNAYKTISGTSMASPHVTGAVALYLSANKAATYDDVYKAFTTTVDTATLTPNNTNCGGVSDATYPNNNYGFGRINVARATSGGIAPPSPSSTPVPTSTSSAPSTAAPSSAAPITPTPTTLDPVPTSAPTNVPVTSTVAPVPTSAPTTVPAPTPCNGCTACYATLIDYCFPPRYTQAQCTTFTHFNAIWCGKK